MIASKPSSMIRDFHLADRFTLASALCGMGALFATMTYLQTSLALHLYVACALIPLALLFDVLDGRIGCWPGQCSEL
ncbi:MAG: hypothetical protein IPK39_13465 [Sulfuritalea sp.]|nr:hypothetical protein [Sulfuritalea sp.]